GLASESSRRDPREGMKPRAKRPKALVADVEADVGYPIVPGQQKPLGLLNPPARHELVRRLPESLEEQAGERKWRQAGLPCGAVQRDSVGIAGSKVVARAAEARERRGIAEPDVMPAKSFSPPSPSSHDQSMLIQADDGWGKRRNSGTNRYQLGGLC